MRRWILFFVLLCIGPLARAQYTFILDPGDETSYREWVKKEYAIAVKMDGPKTVAQTGAHMWKKKAEIPTPETGQVAADFWSADVPAWVRRFATNPFATVTSKPGDSVSDQQTISKLWNGLSVYQRVRATLRTMALVKQSLAGLRFQINAWQMMSKLVDFSDNEVIIDTDPMTGMPYPVDGYTKGTVSLGVVPKGKANWRQIVAYLQDDPLWDDGHTIRWRGPRTLGDVAVDAEEAYVDDTGGGREGLVSNFLDSANVGARAASEGLGLVRQYINQRTADAIRDKFSPRWLAREMRRLSVRRRQAYESIYQLRAILENRSVAQIASEYSDIESVYEDDIRNQLAQAEMAAKFYGDLQNSADNAVSSLMDPDRQQALAKLEKEWVRVFNDEWNAAGNGLIPDLQSVIKNSIDMARLMAPSLVPYLGAVQMPLDVMAVTTGDADAAADEEKDPSNDMYSMLRENQARAFAVRYGYYLWEELRASRQLMYLSEQQRIAAIGTKDDREAFAKTKSAVNDAMEREIALYKMRVANDGIQDWSNWK